MADDFNPDQYLASKTAAPAAAAVPHGTNFDPDQYLADKGEANPVFGTIPQQVAAGAEGAARGVSLGASDLAETKLLGVNPKDIEARRVANPVTSNIGQAAGAGALIYGTGGLGALAEGAGLTGLAATAATYGAEGAVMGAGNAVTDYALGDPHLNAQKIASEIGMGTLLGIGTGVLAHGAGSLLSKSGLVKGSVGDVFESEALGNTSKAEAANEIQARTDLKPNAPEIAAAAKELNAPLTEGMISADPWIQKAEDALVNGAPTYSGIQKAKLYEDGYEAVHKNLTDIVGEPESEGGMTKAELGNALEKSLTSKIAEENAPAAELYNQVKAVTKEVPLSPQSLPRIADNIMNLESVRLDPDGPAGQLAKRMVKNIENARSVDDVKSLRKILNNSLPAVASNEERYVMGEISDRLKALEERTLENHAGKILDHIDTQVKAGANPEEMQSIWGDQANKLQTALAQKAQADKLYAPFIEKVKWLSKALGKKNVSGAQGAINFISTDLSPEQLANRFFQKGNSEIAEGFSKKFPEEWELVKQYQKAALRDSSIQERSGQFNPRAFIKKVNNLEPEIQKLIFNPAELKRINAAKTYLRSIPETFNPSGTSGMSAFREFFHNPAGAAIANARDFGIDAYIKAMGKIPESLRPDALETGTNLADKFNKFNAAQGMMERVNDKIESSAKSIFSNGAGRGIVLSEENQLAGSYEDKVKRISELANQPNVLGTHLSNQTEHINAAMPNTSQALQNGMMASVQYLNSKIPRPQSQFMLSKPWEPSDLQKQKFNKYYKGVTQPLQILNHIKTGQMSSEELEAVSETHPDLFNEMRTQVLRHMSQETAMKLPYPVKKSLAMFLGEPLDSSMLPQVIMANQQTFNMASPNGPSPKQQRSTQSGLAKLKVADRSKTDTQDSLEEQS